VPTFPQSRENQLAKDYNRVGGRVFRPLDTVHVGGSVINLHGNDPEWRKQWEAKVRQCTLELEARKSD
jgi:hypothetical protein